MFHLKWLFRLLLRVFAAVFLILLIKTKLNSILLFRFVIGVFYFIFVICKEKHILILF